MVGLYFCQMHKEFSYDAIFDRSYIPGQTVMFHSLSGVHIGQTSGTYSSRFNSYIFYRNEPAAEASVDTASAPAAAFATPVSTAAAPAAALAAPVSAAAAPAVALAATVSAAAAPASVFAAAPKALGAIKSLGAVKAPGAAKARANYCPCCGTRLDSGAHFCTNCGKKVS